MRLYRLWWHRADGPDCVEEVGESIADAYQRAGFVGQTIVNAQLIESEGGEVVQDYGHWSPERDLSRCTECSGTGRVHGVHGMVTCWACSGRGHFKPQSL
jgi:hypothetical protein